MKRQSDILASAMTNIDSITSALTTSQNAYGSALAENSIYLDSIAAKTELFNKSAQDLWTNTINSETVKTVIDLGTGLLKLVDGFGLLNTVMLITISYFSIFKGLTFASIVMNIGKAITALIAKFATLNITMATLGTIASALAPILAFASIAGAIMLINRAKKSMVDYNNTLRDAHSEYLKVNQDIDNLVSRYKTLNEKVKLNEKEKLQLINIERDLNKAIGNTTRSINLQSDSFEENIKKVEESKEKMLEAFLAMNEEEFLKARLFLKIDPVFGETTEEEYNKLFEKFQGMQPGDSNYSIIKRDLEEMLVEIQAAKDSVLLYENAYKSLTDIVEEKSIMPTEMEEDIETSVNLESSILELSEAFKKLNEEAPITDKLFKMLNDEEATQSEVIEYLVKNYEDLADEGLNVNEMLTSFGAETEVARIEQEKLEDALKETENAFNALTSNLNTIESAYKDVIKAQEEEGITTDYLLDNYYKLQNAGVDMQAVMRGEITLIEALKTASTQQSMARMASMSHMMDAEKTYMGVTGQNWQNYYNRMTALYGTDVEKWGDRTQLLAQADIQLINFLSAQWARFHQTELEGLRTLARAINQQIEMALSIGDWSLAERLENILSDTQDLIDAINFEPIQIPEFTGDIGDWVGGSPGGGSPGGDGDDPIYTIPTPVPDDIEEIVYWYELANKEIETAVNNINSQIDAQKELIAQIKATNKEEEYATKLLEEKNKLSELQNQLAAVRAGQTIEEIEAGNLDERLIQINAEILAQEELFDTINEGYEAEITDQEELLENLKKQREEQDEINKLLEAQQKLTELLTKKSNIEQEKNVRLLTESGWQWVANSKDIESVNNEIENQQELIADIEEEQQYQSEVEAIQSIIDALKEQKELEAESMQESIDALLEKKALLEDEVELEKLIADQLQLIADMEEEERIRLEIQAIQDKIDLLNEEKDALNDLKDNMNDLDDEILEQVDSWESLRDAIEEALGIKLDLPENLTDPTYSIQPIESDKPTYSIQPVESDESDGIILGGKTTSYIKDFQNNSPSMMKIFDSIKSKLKISLPITDSISQQTTQTGNTYYSLKDFQIIAKNPTDFFEQLNSMTNINTGNN